MIAIIDYGMGNVGSIRSMLKRLGRDAMITSDPMSIDRADKLILPGVGAFDEGMKNLESRGLIGVLRGKVYERKAPLLGICLGMQLLSRRSEEGTAAGLGWIAAETRRFHFNGEQAKLRVPHMGWNYVKAAPDAPLFRGFAGVPRYYFVHSFHVCCDRPETVLGTSHYGSEFTAAVHDGNVYGVQFHPEKSHRYGLQLLKNFVEL